MLIPSRNWIIFRHFFQKTNHARQFNFFFKLCKSSLDKIRNIWNEGIRFDNVKITNSYRKFTFHKKKKKRQFFHIFLITTRCNLMTLPKSTKPHIFILNHGYVNWIQLHEPCIRQMRLVGKKLPRSVLRKTWNQDHASVYNIYCARVSLRLTVWSKKYQSEILWIKDVERADNGNKPPPLLG